MIAPFFHRGYLKHHFDAIRGWIYAFTQGTDTHRFYDHDDLTARNKLISFLIDEKQIIFSLSTNKGGSIK